LAPEDGQELAPYRGASETGLIQEGRRTHCLAREAAPLLSMSTRPLPPSTSGSYVSSCGRVLQRWVRLLPPLLSGKACAAALIVAGGLTPAVAQHGRAPVKDEILIQPKAHLTDQALATLLKVHGARQVDSIPQLDVRVLKVPAATRDKVIKALQHNPNIQFAEVNATAAAGAVTNDPYATDGYQWHLSKIRAAEAWDTSVGSMSTVIAVLDTGIAAIHPELAGKLLPGYNFYASNTNTSDDHGHGTKVAGVAAAQGNNGEGVAGVAWNCSILPVKISDPTGSATYSNMAKALTYAADQGARVINISFAGSTASSTLQSAADYVWSKNAIILAAAGNSGTNVAQYPAACRNVVAVSNTTSADTLSTSSTFGSFIALAAPGTGIYTTNMAGGYGASSGTSFASPVVAGVAALLLSYDPEMTNARLLELLTQNADDLGTAGHDTAFGHGRVNAYRALIAAGNASADTTAPTATISAPGHGTTVSGTIQVQVNASDSVGVTKVELYLDGVLVSASSGASALFAWDTTGETNGTHVLRALATDAAGNVGTSTDVAVNVQNAVLDQTPPVTQITSPTAGAIITKNSKIYVVASDNTGVVRVELYVDGVFAASSTSSAPVFNENTARWSKGTHTLQTVAFDAAGNAGRSALVNVVK